MKTTMTMLLLMLTLAVSAQFACGDAVEYQGKEYSTVQIGTQCWFSENLNVGTMVPNSQMQGDNGIIEKYCPGNIASNCDTYGGFYQWNEVMQFGGGDICPNGWHVPSYDDFTELVDYAGGKSLAGAKLKKTGYDQWERVMKHAANDDRYYANKPTWKPTNETGFTWLGGGYITVGRSGYMNKVGYLWTSTIKESNYFLPQYSDITPYPVQVSATYSSPQITFATMWVHQALPVRCVRD